MSFSSNQNADGKHHLLGLWLVLGVIALLMMLGCRPSETMVPPTPTPDTERLIEIFYEDLLVILRDAENRGLISAANVSDAMAFVGQREPPDVIGTIERIDSQSIGIRTFFGNDPARPFAGEYWEFAIVDGYTRAFLGPTRIELHELVNELEVGEMIRVLAQPSREGQAFLIVGYGVRGPR